LNSGGTMVVPGDMTVLSSLNIASGGTVILDESAPFAAPPMWLDAEDGFTAQTDDLDGDANAFADHRPGCRCARAGICAVLASAFVLFRLRHRQRQARHCHRTMSAY